MKQDHIDYNTLSMYVKAVSYGNATLDNVGMDSEQYHYVLDHIAGCSECREQVTAITTLLNDHAYIDHQSELTPEKQKFICNYLEGKLHAEEAAEAKALIETNDDAMKAALHYQNHTESMKSHLAIEDTLKSEVTESTKVQKLNASFFGQITSMFDQLLSMKSPLIYTMTATATLLFAVMLIINSSEMTQQQTMIASYQDNPTIQFTEKNKLPGVGFFAQSGNMSSPFEDINIELVSENTIKISWPDVDGAELYKMRIQVFNHGKKSVLKEASTENNHAVFNLEPADKQVDENKSASTKSKATSHLNKRYEWILYGNTIDDKMFYASGGFVIGQGY